MKNGEREARHAQNRILRLKQRGEKISTLEKFKKLDQWKSLRNLTFGYMPLVVLGAIFNAPLLVATGLSLVGLSVARRLFGDWQAERLHKSALEAIDVSAEHISKQIKELIAV